MRAQFLRVLKVEAALLTLVWAIGLGLFLSRSSGVAERFAELAKGPYLSFAALVQARVLLSHLVLAAVLAFVVTPFTETSSGLRLVPRVLAANMLVLVLSLGPALLGSPGFFDTLERKSRLDLSWLLRGLWPLTALFAVMIVVVIGRWVSSQRVRVALGAVVLAGAAFDVWPRPVPSAEALARPNVLIIASDSWRFDRLGVHGATRKDLTPNLDAFAASAVDFRQHHVSTASTLESWTTLLTGQFPPRHGLRSMYPSRDEVAAVESNADTLPRLLRARGYDTFVSSDWVGNCFDLVDFGFEHPDVAPVQNFEALLLEETMRAHLLTSLVFSVTPSFIANLAIPGRERLAWAADPLALVDQLFGRIDDAVRAQRPFFGVLFVSPTHLPYNARHPFSSKYAARDYRGPHRFQVEVSAHELITTGFSPTLPSETIEHIRDLYDGAVSDFDDTAGRVLRGLQQRGLERNTIVVVTSDHGEDLYEAGSTLGHGTNFFGGDQSTRVPLLVRAPGLTAGVVNAVTRTVDVAPTLLSMLQQPTVPASMQGVDLGPLARRERDDLQLIAYAETCYLFFPKAQAMTVLSAAERAEVVDLAGAADTLDVDPTFRHNLVLKPSFRDQVVRAKDRMVRDARHKLIVIPGKTREVRRLFDVVADPSQQHDLAGTGLEAETRLRELLINGELPR